MSKHVLGLNSVEIADIANDGGVGTVWTVIGETALGSATLSSTDATTTDIKIEESDSPVESIVSDPSVINVNWSSYNLDADAMVLLYGGTKTTGPPVKWDAPDALPVIEKSLRVTDKKGNVVVMPRVSIKTKLNLSFKKDGLGQLDMSATVLQPTKSGTKRLTITYA